MVSKEQKNRKRRKKWYSKNKNAALSKQTKNVLVLKNRKKHQKFYSLNKDYIRHRRIIRYQNNSDFVKKQVKLNYMKNLKCRKRNVDRKFTLNLDVKKKREKITFMKHRYKENQKIRNTYGNNTSNAGKESCIDVYSNLEKKKTSLKYFSRRQHSKTIREKILSRCILFLREAHNRKSNLNKQKKMPKIGKKCLRRQKKINLFSDKWINIEMITRKIAKQLKGVTFVKKVIEAKSIIKWCFYTCKKSQRTFYNRFRNLKEKFCNIINKLEFDKNLHNEIEILCGESLHTKATEPYYYEFSYKKFTNQQKKIAVNEKHQAANIFHIINENVPESKTRWKCSYDICKLENETISCNMKNILKTVSACPIKKSCNYFVKLNHCSNENFNITKRHSLSCYENNNCKSFLPYLRTLSPHFPRIRNYLRTIYAMINIATKISAIREALKCNTADHISFLKKTAERTCKQAKEFQYNTLSETLSECEILSAFQNAFISAEKRCSDMPRHPCISCERLCFRRQIKAIHSLRIPLQGTFWDELVHIKKNETANGYICRTCLDNFRQNKLPAICILNGLYVYKQPEEIASLNTFEKVLIQRAKAFQVVTRMDTAGKNRSRVEEKIKKVKGRTFHLPLPLEETLEKLPEPEDIINSNSELFVLLRSLPTKRKVIWETLIDVKKVYNALKILKEVNHLYRNINLPNSSNDIIERVKNSVFITNDENIDREKKRAILTEVSLDEWHAEHLEYTIHALNETTFYETDSRLYKMLKVEENPIDFREKYIDLLCFPDLYVNGMFGQFHERKVKLTSAEFIKCRLMSKQSQFRLNQQYLFYLLHDSNLRQLKQGIFHKLNTSNCTDRLTVEEYLKKLSEGKLEGDLTSIFSKLRNTAQYWTKPRNDVRCMTYHYGPATWFLTISPSEWNWNDLATFIIEMNSLVKNIHKKSTSELVAFDPVSASRFIDNKFQSIIDFILSPDAPLGKVNHYFFRREYQNRGLQHFHILLWVEEAPILGISSNDDVAKFIEKYLTCKIPDENVSPTIYQRVKEYQTHKHNSYCLRNKKTKKGFKKVCRFGFPRPVRTSLILRDTVEAVAERKSLKSNGRLYDLMRTVKQQYINDYNASILLAWNGNIDLQYIGEKTTMLNWYITKYTTKSENSHENIFTLINSTKSLSSRLFNIGLRTLSNRECGSLEAADTLLGIPLYGTDSKTSIKWLDVNINRKKRLQPINKIKELDRNSTNIFFKSMADDHYPNRPKELEMMTLYDFVRWFDVRSKPSKLDVEKYPTLENKFLVKRSRPYIINHYKYSYKQESEKYYFASLFMFMPWRNITDVKRNFNSYEESFFEHNETIIEAMQYDKKLRELEEVIERTKELVQNKQAEFKIKESNERKELEFPVPSKNFENTNVAQDMKQTMENILLFNENNSDSLELTYSRLNRDQKRVFNYVTNVLKHGNETNKILRHFVSGVGGTGKSFLINAIRIWTKINMNGSLTAVSAPTGLSAYNISGTTIYKLFQLPVEHMHTPKFRPVSDDALKIMRHEMKNVTLFIIDEISMVSNITFLYIHLRLSEVFATTDEQDGWFGKKHILLFGDLLQLPPVHEESPFIPISEINISKYLGSLTCVNLWNELLTYDELTINMRQEKDKSYAEILERVRLGKLLLEDQKFLENHKIPLLSKNATELLKEIGNYLSKLPFETIALCATSNQCEELNIEMLSRIEGEEIHLKAKDLFDCAPYLKVKMSKLLSKYDTDSTRTAVMEKIIIIKVGAKVMLRRNIDVKRGLVNSAIGIVSGIKRNIENNDIDVIKICFSNGITYDLERVTSKFELTENAFVYREKFPITLSYAITIHKSQGLSLKNVLLDVGESIFTRGQTYVALSRVVSSEGIHLINFNPYNIKAQKSAIEEYNRLRSQFRPDLPLFSTSDADNNKYVKDRRWITNAELKQIQHSESPFENKRKSKTQVYSIALNVSGFTNIDSVSCYANSVMQCLYRSKHVRLIIKSDEFAPEYLKENLIHYEQKTLVDAKNIRKGISSTYVENVQQDCVQFIEHVISNYTSLKDIFSYTQKHTLFCRNCNYTKVNETEETVIRFPITSSTVSIQNMFKATFDHWEETDDNYKCIYCGTMGKAQQKYEIVASKQHIALQFLIFNNDLVKINDVKITGIPNSKIKISGNFYHPLSAIFHHGLTIFEGHYTAIFRKNNKWILADDAKIKETRWPTGSKNIYMLLLKKAK